MKRRDFIALLGGTAAAWPLAAGAQTSPKIPRIGYIAGAGSGTFDHIGAAFRRGLTELGYVEGQTIALEVRYAQGRTDRIPELVAELVGLKMDVLVAGNSVAALAAQKATRTIPIVMVAADPVGLGLVVSLARPGGNVTGLSYFNEAIIAKRRQLLKELVPGLVQVAVLRNPSIAVHAIFWQETEVVARTLGVALQPLNIRGPDDFEGAFAAATQANAQALIALDDALTISHRPRIVALAASSRLPAMYGLREFPDDGGLISYGPSFVDLFRRAATYVDKILKGAKPADLPVEQPTKFELVINRKTANALGLTVPPTLLTQADDVIESKCSLTAFFRHSLRLHRRRVWRCARRADAGELAAWRARRGRHACEILDRPMVKAWGAQGWSGFAPVAFDAFSAGAFSWHESAPGSSQLCR